MPAELPPSEFPPARIRRSRTALLAGAALGFAAVAPAPASAQTNSFVTAVGGIGASRFAASFGDYLPRTFAAVPAGGLAVADPGQGAGSGAILTTTGIAGRNSGVTALGGLTQSPCTNGQWDPTRASGPGGPNGGAYIVSFGGTATLTFASLLSGVGFTLNYLPTTCGSTGPTLSLYGNDGALLAAYDIDALAAVSTRDPETGIGLLNAGAFRGASRATADVRSITISGATTFVLDDLRYTTTLVGPPPTTTPEPASVALVCVGLVGVGAVRRRSAR